MNEREVSEKLVEWIADVCEIDTDSAYPYPVAQKLGALPDVAGIVDRKRTALPGELEDVFVASQLQQVLLMRVFECSASIMVEVEETEDSAKTQFQALQDYGAALEASALDDATLGDRVPTISPVMAFDYSPVFGSTADGTRGRLITCEFTIGEPIEELGD